MTTTIQDVNYPSASLLTVVPSNTVDLTVAARSIYVGMGGDIKVQDISGTDVTFKNTAEGTMIGPFFIKRIYATGTTASNLVAFI